MWIGCTAFMYEYVVRILETEAHKLQGNRVLYGVLFRTYYTVPFFFFFFTILHDLVEQAWRPCGSNRKELLLNEISRTSLFLPKVKKFCLLILGALTWRQSMASHAWAVCETKSFRGSLSPEFTPLDDSKA